MRLIIFLLFVSVFAYGQEGISPIDVGTANGGDGEPLRNAMIKVNNNDQSLASSVSGVQASISGVAGVTLSFDGDTMFVNDGATTREYLAIASQDFVPGPPNVNSAEVGNVEDSIIVLTMDKDMADSVSYNAASTVTQNSLVWGIDTSIIYTGGVDDEIWILLDSALYPEEAITLDYSRPLRTGDYQSTQNSYLVSFSDLSVSNNISCQTSPPIADFRMENNGNSEVGAATITPTGGAGYTAGFKVEGSYGGDLDGSGFFFGVSSLAYGTIQTINLWNYRLVGTGSGTFYSTLQSNDGVQIDFNYATHIITLTTGSGGGLTTAVSSAVPWTTGNWHLFSVVINQLTDACAIYFNGVDVTSTTTIDNGFTTTSIARIGLDFSGNGSTFSIVDRPIFYDVAMTTAEVLSFYNDPTTAPTIGNCGDPPVPSDSVETLWEVDWDLFSTTTSGVTATQLNSYYPGYYSLGSSIGGVADYAYIINTGPYNVMQAVYPQDHCCTEVQYSWGLEVANGGTGWDPRAYITSEATYYRELYLSYEIWIMVGFLNSWAFKLPSLGAKVDVITGRFMVRTLSGENNSLNPVLYYGEYSSDYTTTSQKSGNSPQAGLTTGAWHTVTMRFVWSSSAHAADGLIEMFIDEVFTGQGKYNLRLMDHGDPSGMDVFDFSTFMGGGGVEYQSPIDQWIRYRGVKIWRYKAGQSGIPYGSTSSGFERNIFNVFE